jgi:hypothetical protein
MGACWQVPHEVRKDVPGVNGLSQVGGKRRKDSYCGNIWPATARRFLKEEAPKDVDIALRDLCSIQASIGTRVEIMQGQR